MAEQFIRPPDYSAWATDPGAEKSQPALAKTAQGWVASAHEKPVGQEVNWILYNTGLWQLYRDENLRFADNGGVLAEGTLVPSVPPMEEGALAMLHGGYDPTTAPMAEEWGVDLGAGTVGESVCTDGGLLFVKSDTGVVRALSLLTGAQLWTVTLGAAGTGGSGMWCPGDHLYVVDGACTLYTLNRLTGATTHTAVYNGTIHDVYSDGNAVFLAGTGLDGANAILGRVNVVTPGALLQQYDEAGGTARGVVTNGETVYAAQDANAAHEAFRRLDYDLTNLGEWVSPDDGAGNYLDGTAVAMGPTGMVYLGTSTLTAAGANVGLFAFGQRPSETTPAGALAASNPTWQANRGTSLYPTNSVTYAAPGVVAISYRETGTTHVSLFDAHNGAFLGEGAFGTSGVAPGPLLDSDGFGLFVVGPRTGAANVRRLNLQAKPGLVRRFDPTARYRAPAHRLILRCE